jgi:palmitoyltransferase
VLGNYTTLDELKGLKSNFNSGENTDANPYDLGAYYNFIFYFGNNPILWFFPVGKPLGDGYHWDKKAM